MENCVNCHEAHGSSNPQLLKMRMPRVCDSCHVTESAPNDSNPAQFGPRLQSRLLQTAIQRFTGRITPRATRSCAEEGERNEIANASVRL